MEGEEEVHWLNIKSIQRFFDEVPLDISFILLWFSMFIFSFSNFFKLISFSLTCWGVRGHQKNLWPSKKNMILLVLP